MKNTQQITPHLWFDRQAEEAAQFYVSVFKNSSIDVVSRYGKAGQEIHGMPEGLVMTMVFTLNGQKFMAINGGPVFKFNEAISFVITCEDQDEIDHYWNKLTEGGDAAAQQCGWLKDKFGVSWQVVPAKMGELMSSGNPAKSDAVMTEMLKMKKIELGVLEEAFERG
ncbi:MAG: VOC family protein [Bacteroidota bacterium]